MWIYAVIAVVTVLVVFALIKILGKNRKPPIRPVLRMSA